MVNESTPHETTRLTLCGVGLPCLGVRQQSQCWFWAKVSDNTYAVLARRGAETVVIAHPDAWTGDEASWQRAKAATVAALAQRKCLRPRTPVRVQLKDAAKAFAMVACCYVVLGLFGVGILWLEAIGLLGLVLVPLAIFLMIGIDEAMTAPTQRKRPPRRR